MHCTESVASGSQTEYNSKGYQELIHCHHSNTSASNCSQPCNDVEICNQNRNVCRNNAVTDTNDHIVCCCTGAEAHAISQAKRHKQNAEYEKVAAVYADDNDACGYSKPSSCQAICHDRHDNDYHQLFASHIRYYGTCMTVIQVALACSIGQICTIC